MLGLCSNPISAISIPPLNTFSALLPSSACTSSLNRAHLFTNLYSLSPITNFRTCACACSSSTTASRPPAVVALRSKAARTTTSNTPGTTTTTTTATNASGRIAHARIEETTAVRAKTKAAVRATVVAASVSCCSSCTCTTWASHFFVRVPTHHAANIIALLRDPALTLQRRISPSHIRVSPSSFSSSSSPAFPYPLRRRPPQPLFSFRPKTPLLPPKEALAISKSLARALLQTPLRRQVHFYTVPRKAVVLAAAFFEPFFPRLPTRQPAYPGASPDLQLPVAAAAAAAAAALPQARSPSLFRQYDPKEYFLQSPFRNRAASSAARRLPHLSAARLWNPTNSTPRLPDKLVRKRRPSTPPPPAVPLSHPTLDPSSVDPSDPLGIGAGDYPLLTLPEQRQTRHSTSNRASLQVDRTANAEHRISLPPSLRHSYDGRRSADPSPTFPDRDSGPADDKGGSSVELPADNRLTGLRKPGQSVSNPPVRDFAITLDINKGKGKAVMEQATESQGRGASKDLERGPDVLPRHSNVSAGDGIGSAISSSDSSIMGEELPPDLGEEWGPQHPCFPHLNPHVPLDSPEYHNTRIIRVRRDWLIEGDLAPTFSNLYPEILDPAGLSEQEFRRIIDKLNGELVPIFSPYNWRNVVDGLLGLVTGWLWDDLGFTGVKARLKRLERWIDQWNVEMEKTVGNGDSSMAPRIISLRKTGYMTLDIQIPDPEIAPAPSTPGGSRSENMPMEPPAAVTA
ncbi:Ras modification protein ERF4 [Colletotrichum shisoi]|uniref:Ras modification protein ERF4 n=1 Tax=Colletotrichum shisoi TaxID=2078593 RepID=A0A5Q4C0M1_9PEZI|nr:Ras modification protein ERF4 [Colletotrichum shisoi]